MARSEAKTAAADLERQRERTCSAKRQWECAQAKAEAALRLVEVAESEKVEAIGQAEKKLKLMHHEWRQERLQLQRESTRALREAEAKVLRLGSQVAAAAHEAAMHARNGEELRVRLETEHERAEVEAERLREESLRLRKERKRADGETARAVRDAEAIALRLGSQVTAALQEAARKDKEVEDVRGLLEDKENELKEALDSGDFYRNKAKIEAQARRERYKECLAALAARDAAKETSQKRLEAKRALTDCVSELKEELESARDEIAALRAQLAAEHDAAAKLALMPTWQRHRQGRRGGGLRLEHSHRLAILEQHANGTPPSCIGRNIVSIVKKAAPWLNPVQPTVREIRQMGFELTTLEETLSARKCAAAYKVRLLGFDETTDRQEPVLTSNVQIQVDKDGPAEDLVLKAAYLSTKGGTSEAVVSEIEEKCFARLRELLVLWRKHHQRLFAEAPWTGPDPQLCSLHRLAGGGGLMSDTCNAARKVKKLLRDLIRSQAEACYRQAHGDEAWDAITDDKREEVLRVHVLDCHQHLRNIWLGHMSRKQVMG